MYAVIKTGGKQYRVEAGQQINVERLTQEPGETITLEEVLLMGEGVKVTVGTPHVKGGTVSAKVLSHGRHKKINIVKFKRRQGYLRNKGHRQQFTQLEILDIKQA